MPQEFSQKIGLCPTTNLPETIESPYPDFDILYSNIQVIPEFPDKLTRAGNLYEFDLRVIVDDTYKEVLANYKNNRPFVLLVFDTSGNAYQVGTKEIPIRATITPVRFVYELKMTAKLLKQPF